MCAPKKEKGWLKTDENPCRDLTIPFEQHMMAMARWTPSLSWFYSCSKTGWGCRDAGNDCCVSSLSQSSIIFKGSLKLTLMSADDDFCIVLCFTLLSVPLRTEPSALELVTCPSCVIRVACLQLMDALLHCPCHIRNDWSCLNALPTSLLTASALCPSVRKHQQLLVMRIDCDDLFPHKYLSELHGCLLGGTQEHQITRQAAATTRKRTPTRLWLLSRNIEAFDQHLRIFSAAFLRKLGSYPKDVLRMHKLALIEHCLHSAVCRNAGFCWLRMNKVVFEFYF